MEDKKSTETNNEGKGKQTRSFLGHKRGESASIFGSLRARVQHDPPEKRDELTILLNETSPKMRRPPSRDIVFDWPNYETRLQEKIRARKKKIVVFNETQESNSNSNTTTHSRQPLIKSPSFFSGDEDSEEDDYPDTASQMAEEPTNIKRRMKDRRKEDTEIDWRALGLTVFQFPSDDVSITEEKNVSKVEIPDELKSTYDVVEPYIKECVKLFTQGSSVIHRKYHEYGNRSKHLNSIVIGETPLRTVSSVRLSMSKSDAPPLSQVFANLTSSTPNNSTPSTPSITPSSSETEVQKLDATLLAEVNQYRRNIRELVTSENRITKQNAFREDLFKCFPVNEKDLNPGVLQPNQSFIEKLSDYLLLLDDFKLNLVDYPSIENLHFCFSLHSLKEKQKITEDCECLYEEKKSKKFLFSLSHAPDLSDIIMIIRVNRPFNAATALQTYNAFHKPETLRRDPELTKSTEDVPDTHVNSSPQVSKEPHTVTAVTPFLWGFVRLFDDQSKLLGTVMNPLGATKKRDLNDESTFTTRKFNIEMKLIKPTSCVLDKDIYECLESEAVMRRFKNINGKLSIDVKKLSGEPRGKRLNSSWQIVRQNSEKNHNEEAIIHEVQNFAEESDFPGFFYVNNLYIYPEYVLAKAPHDANIQVKVELRSNDHNVKEEGLPVFYNPFTNEFCSSMTSVVAVHNKAPYFSGEIKMKIPTNLTTKHHLFFTFSNIGNKRGNKAIVPVGYAIVHLWNNKQILYDERHQVPVSKGDFPTNDYLENNKVKFSREKKFIFRTRLKSSIFPQDPAINSFLLSYPKESKELPQIIQSLPEVDAKVFYRFSPVIMNALFQLICRSPEEQAKLAFISIITLLKRLDSQAEHAALHAYVVYLFENPPRTIKDNTNTPVHEYVVKFWLQTISDDCMEGFTSYWFLFSIITKSMALELNANGQLQNVDNSKKFSAEYLDNLQKLFAQLVVKTTEKPQYDVVISFPLFLIGLFPLVDRGIVLKMIYTHINKFPLIDITSSFIRFTWLKIVTDYEHYIPLNMPHDMEMSIRVPEVLDLFFKRHFLAGLLLNDVQSSLKESSKIRDQAITVLRNILRKHELDERYQSRSVRGYIAGIYFPFILIMVDNFKKSVKDIPDPEIQKWLLCFLYILKHIKRRILRSWWRKETQKRTSNFIALLQYSLDLYMDKNRIVEVNFIVLDILVVFIDQFERNLNKEEHPHMPKIFQTIKQLLNSTSEHFLHCIYTALVGLIFKLKKPLFAHKTTSYCQDLIYKILQHCNHASPEIRNKASTLFYLLMKANFQETETTSRIKHFAIVAFSKFVGSDSRKNYNYLNSSFDAIIKFVQAEKSSVENSKEDSTSLFATQAEEVVTKLIDMSKYDKRIASYWADEELVGDLYVKIANDFIESPENLSVLHVQNGNTEEAAQCKIHNAFFVAKYLVRTTPKQLPADFRDLQIFQKISPNAFSDRDDLPSEIYFDDTRFQSELWDITGLVKLLKEGITLLERERRYELSLEIYMLLSAIHKHDRNYSAMISWAKSFEQLCDNLVRQTKEGKEVFSRFYRVSFYGKKFEGQDENGKMYIYKKKFKFPIGEISIQLQRQLATRFGLEKKDVVPLPNKEVDHSSLDPEKIYYQIVAVQPYFIPSELEERVSAFQQNFNIRQFISEVPLFSGEGKFDESDVARIQKKKTIYIAKKAFPYVTNRIEIISEQAIILSPIECAIEAMAQRVNQLRNEVYSNPVRKNNLQALLTGTLATTVHVGPLRFCEVFLANSNYEPEKQEKLREFMAETLLLAKVGLQINAGIIGPEQLPFQEMLETKFQTAMQLFQENYAGSLRWAKLQSNIQETERKLLQQQTELEKKLKTNDPVEK